MNRAKHRSNWLASYRQQTTGNSAQAPQASTESVRLHISEMVLHGFPAHSRYSIAESTKAELTTLLTGQGIPTKFKATGEQSAVDAGSFQLTPNARPNAIGSLVARAIYRSTK